MLNRWEKVEDNKIKLEIEVDAAEVDSALEKAYRKVVKKVNLPGFRKGKVPRKLLEARFGPEVLHEEALEELVPPAYEKALEEADINPINQPEFDLVQVEEGKPLIFNAIVEVLPEVDLGEYKGLEAEKEEVEVDDVQVDHHIYMLREQNARLVPREDRPAQHGDLLLIDFKGYVDGESFEGGEAEDYSLELGSQSFIPGFEEQLIGVNLNEETEVKVTFPEDYRNEELAGKEAVFNVTIKQIKEKQLPDLDDEFVKEVSEFETLDEMKADIKEKMLKNAEEQSKTKLEESLIEKVSEASEVKLPEVLVERQIDRMISDMENYLRQQGLGMDQFLELSGKTKEEMRNENRPEAERRTKANLVLDAIVKKEGITVDDSEVDAKINEIAESYNDQFERVKGIFEKQGRLPAIKEEMRIRKAVDLIVENANITMVKKEQESGNEEAQEQQEKQDEASNKEQNEDYQDKNEEKEE
ncbi:MAG: trigger factor [Bacillota bacterium]